MNAIALLKADHRLVEELFEKLVRLEGTSRGNRSKRPLLERLIRELSIHAAIEEEVFYPVVKTYVPDTAERVLVSLEEHGVIKWELFALEATSVGDARFGAKVKVLRDTVRRHIDEEERALFPLVRDALDAAALSALGARLDRARKTAPTHPHPRSPDEPPANLLVNMGISVLDRVRDAGRAVRRARNHARRERDDRSGKLRT